VCFRQRSPGDDLAEPFVVGVEHWPAG
jgi:hypothetical protein